MIWAACCTAFFGFMRCGEFTSPSHSAYDPTVHLSFSDVAVDSKTCPTFIRLTIKQSKTDQTHHKAIKVRRWLVALSLN